MDAWGMPREVDPGEVLRAWRTKRGLSLRAMGKILSCDHSRVWKIENGRMPMTFGVAEAGDWALDTGGALVAAVSNVQKSIRPAQLPAAPALLVGRNDELATLAAAIRDRPQGTPVVVAIDGPAGVGKTALALRWTHDVAHQYVDGQLYANLRGFAPAEHRAQVTVHAVLEEFLVALGAGSMPKTTEQRAALFRSLVADRKVLVLLDNVAGAHDIWSLLPASARCAVVVTSRRALSGLVGEVGATRVTVRPLAELDAVTLVSQTIGVPRADAETTAVTKLTRLCGHLPLALHAAAEQIAIHPQRLVTGLVTELAEDDYRLGVGEITDLATVFSWSYRDMDPDAARLFRLLGLHRGEHLSVAAAAALAGITVPFARRLLHRLAAIHLIDIDSHGLVQLHDLVGAYARVLVVTEEVDDQRRAAARRLVTWYVHTVDAARRAMGAAPAPLDEALSGVDGVRSPDFPNGDTARAWRDAERSNVESIATLAMDYGPHGAAQYLATELVSVTPVDSALTDAEEHDTSSCGTPDYSSADDQSRPTERTKESQPALPEQLTKESSLVTRSLVAALTRMYELHEGPDAHEDHLVYDEDNGWGDDLVGPPWLRCPWGGAHGGSWGGGWDPNSFSTSVRSALRGRVDGDSVARAQQRGEAEPSESGAPRGVIPEPRNNAVTDLAL